MTDPQLPPPPGARSTPDGPPPAPPAYAPAPTAAPVPPAYDAAPVPPAYDAAPVPPSYAAAPVPQAYATAPGAYPTAAPVAPAAPPGAYAVPVGGYAVPSGAYSVPDAAPQRSGVLGSLALVFSLVAAVVAPILGGISAFEIGRRLPYGVSSGNDLSVLSPARDQVLWAELSFWTGTVFGVAALVLGIIAIRRRQGRGSGIAALVLAVLGVVIFSAVVLVTFAVGGAAGFAGSPA
ncbi:hypothetical protein [Microbacterium sp. PF5]|uniref:hypothetical protein n=1 Tax=Microbacterium sp. PF5 TaxID=2305435 RepID=UPI001F0D315B|nr:hypothetical protein [Microbacterium sp. PF5]